MQRVFVTSGIGLLLSEYQHLWVFTSCPPAFPSIFFVIISYIVYEKLASLEYAYMKQMKARYPLLWYLRRDESAQGFISTLNFLQTS